MESVLAIESAVANGSIAVFMEGQTSVVHAAEGAARAERILSIVEEILQESGLALDKLDRIAVSIGPGSYSGIRIGMSTALGLRDALGISCIGVPVLAAMAEAAPDSGPVTCAVPVGKNDVAWQPYGASKADRRESVCEPQLCSVIKFASELSLMPGTALFAHTNLLDRMAGAIPPETKAMDAGSRLAEYVGRFAMRWPDGEGTMKPIYLRNQMTQPQRV